MDAHGACDLCGEPVGADGSGEIAELSLCPACHAGDFWDRLVDRGIRLQCFGKAHYSFDGKVGGRTRDVRGAIPYDLGVDGHFSTEDIFTKIGKVFVKELQVGDPAFDDVLYISTDDKDALSELLQDEGLRAAILHAVTAREDKSLVLEGGRLSLDGLSVSIEEVPATLRDLALVLHHLERIARERGLERRPELARYPDLRDTVEYVESCRTIGQKNFWPKAVFLQGATLDDLEPVARIHDGMTPGKQPLQILRLMHSHLISGDLSPLATMTTLRVLELDEIPAARTLPSLRRLERLEELTIKRCPLTDLAPLAGLRALTELWVPGAPITDLRPLDTIHTLKKLDIRGTLVRDLSLIHRMPALEMLWIKGLPIPDEQVRALRAARPHLELDPY